jgi:hypothetical protein
MRFLGNTIRPETVKQVLAKEYVTDVYLEAAHDWAVVVPAAEDGGLPANWYEIAGLDLSLETMMFTELADPLLATTCMEHFRKLNSIRYLHDIPGVVRRFSDFTFVQNFYYEIGLEFENGERVPVVLSEYLAEIRGLGLGDEAYIAVTIGATRVWEFYPAVVVGFHNRNILTNRLRDSAIIPHSALTQMKGEHKGYIVVEFNIDPAWNREIDTVREELTYILRQMNAAFGRIRLGVTLRDGELRTMVGTVDQTLGLLRLLYPAAVGLSGAIAIGLSALIMLQNAKNAAIKRVLGGTKIKTQTVFCAEILFLNLAGLIIGLIVVVILGWNFGLLHAIALAALYFAGTVIGAVAGAVLITNRPPLDLLQVKE